MAAAVAAEWLAFEVVGDVAGGGVLLDAVFGADDAVASVFALDEGAGAVCAEDGHGFQTPGGVSAASYVGSPHRHRSSPHQFATEGKRMERAWRPTMP